MMRNQIQTDRAEISEERILIINHLHIKVEKNVKAMLQTWLFFIYFYINPYSYRMKIAFFLLLTNIPFLEKAEKNIKNYSLSMSYIDSVFTNNPSEYEKAKAYWIRGYLEYHQKNYSQALINNLEGLRSLERSGKSHNYVELSLKKNIGAILFKFGMYNESLDFYRQSLKMADSDKEKSSLYYNMALSFSRLNKLGKCTEYLLMGLDITRDRDQQAKFYNKLGTINREVGNYSEAKKYLLKAKHIENQISDRYRNMTYHNLATVFDKWGKIEEAKEYYLKSITLREGHQKFISLTDLSDLHLRQGNAKKALFYGNKAIQYEDQAIKTDKDHLVYRVLSRAYYQIKKYDSAQYFSEKLFLKNDEIAKKRKMAREENNRFKMQMITKLYDSNLQRIQQQKKNTRLLILIVSTVLIVGIVLFALITNKRKRTSKRMERVS